MTTFPSLRVTNRLEATYVTGVRVNLDVVSSVNGGINLSNDLTFEQAHALADWIIANVPKPEPTPLPTKFAAVVKSKGTLYTLADDEQEPKWIEAGTNGGTWESSDFLRGQGFEVIYEGVED